MNKRSYKRDKIPLMELKLYLESEKIGRYIFSSTYQLDCINSYTLRMNMIFKNINILFNPNKIFLYGSEANPDDKTNYVIIERIKYVKIEELDSSINVEFICGNLNNDDDNYTYKVYVEKNI